MFVGVGSRPFPRGVRTPLPFQIRKGEKVFAIGFWESFPCWDTGLLTGRREGGRDDPRGRVRPDRIGDRRREGRRWGWRPVIKPLP